jgi:hypothetical protein
MVFGRRVRMFDDLTRFIHKGAKPAHCSLLSMACQIERQRLRHGVQGKELIRPHMTMT